MHNEKKGDRRRMALFALLHLGCCGIPLLLLLSGVSLASFVPHLPWLAPLAVVLVGAAVWSFARGCAASCPPRRQRPADAAHRLDTEGQP